MSTQIDDHYYPITKDSVDKFVREIVETVNSNGCISYMFNELVGGSRAWIKFIINNPEHTRLYKDLSNSKFVVFEPSDCTEQSSLNFLYQLLLSIQKAYDINQTFEYNSLSTQTVLDNIKNIINKLPRNEKMVIFAIKMDSFQDMNTSLGNLLYSIWKDDKDKLSFIFTFSKFQKSSELKTKYGLFFEAISQKIVEIKRVSDQDIKHSILHWGQKINYTFNNKEIETIVKYSNGMLYLSKVLSQEIGSKSHTKNIDLLCKNVVQNHISVTTNDNLSINKHGNIVILNGVDISHLFTYQEFSVLKLLIYKSGSIVNRDDIAYSLWGDKSFEKYSDWAIDKYISLVRAKLTKLNFNGSIKAKKGEGFSLIQV